MMKIHSCLPMTAVVDVKVRYVCGIENFRERRNKKDIGELLKGRSLDDGTGDHARQVDAEPQPAGSKAKDPRSASGE